MGDAAKDTGSGSDNAELLPGDIAIVGKEHLGDDDMGTVLAKTLAQLKTMTAERDAAVAQLAKLDAAPKARSGAIRARKVGPVKDKIEPRELLELIGAANVVELAFSDGKKELTIPARQISGKAWIVTAVGLKLQLPELIVEGPDGGAQSLAGYGLFLDGEQVAWAARPDVIEMVPRRKTDLRHDVVFN